MRKVIRIDCYVGFDDENEPRQRQQFLFNLMSDDIDELSQVVQRNIEDTVAEMVNEES